MNRILIVSSRMPPRVHQGFRGFHSRILNKTEINEIYKINENTGDLFSISDLARIQTDVSSLKHLLNTEILNRLSKTIVNLPTLFDPSIRDQRSYQFIEDYFHMNFKEISKLKTRRMDEKDLLFTIKHVETRLGGTTEMISDAILSSGVLSKNEEHIRLQSDINTIFKSNLSVEVLVSLVVGGLTSRLYLDPETGLIKNINTAFDNARYLCEQYYISSPELIITGDEELKFSYFPSHLYLIFFEIIKNSLRASVEHHGEGCEHIPPVVIHLETEDDFIVVCLRDSGGGYRDGDLTNLFQFFRTSASINSMSLYQGAHSSPLAGYGFGLGMVKIYLEQFGGQILLENTTEGMIVKLKFRHSPEQALEFK